MRSIVEGGSKHMPTRKATSKRELIEPHKGDKRYKADGTFGETVDVGKSLSADQKRTAKVRAIAATE
jgi:hypothetical protein